MGHDMEAATKVLERAVDLARKGPLPWRVMALLGRDWASIANVSAASGLKSVLGVAAQSQYQTLGWTGDVGSVDGNGSGSHDCCNVIAHGALGHPSCPCGVTWENI